MLKHASESLERQSKGKHSCYGRRTLIWFMIVSMIATVWMSSVVTGATSTDEIPPRYTKVVGGEFYTVALRNDGSVWEWGRNMTGSLALQKMATYMNTSAPVRVGGLSDIVDIHISNGYAQNLAVKSDGTVWQWGADDSRKYEERGTYSILPEQIKGVKDTVAITVTDKHGYALHKDGTVWRWSRLANKEHTADGSPSIQVKGLSQIVQVEVANGKMYAVKQDGTVWSLAEGELLKGSPKKIKGLTNIKQIYSELMFLDKKGKLWRVGDGGKVSGVQLTIKVKEKRGNLLLSESGDVYEYDNRKATSKISKVNGLPKIKTIGKGAYHNLAVSEDGIMWGWGGNKYLELGAPTASPDGMAYRPIQALEDIDIYLNGSVLSLSYPAIKTKVSVQLPLVSLAKAMGAKVTYTLGSSGYPGTYTLTYKDKTVVFQTHQMTMHTDTQTMELPETMSVVGGAVTIPYQLLQLGLDMQVTWAHIMRRVEIVDKEISL